MHTTNLAHVIGRGTLIQSLNSFILKGISLLSIFLVLTVLSPYEYGVIELSLSIFSLSSIFLLPGLIPVITNDITLAITQHKNNTAKNILTSYALFQLLISSVIALTIFVISFADFSFISQNNIVLLRIISLLILISPLRTLTQTMLTVFIKFEAKSAYSVIEEISKLSFMVFAFYILNIHLSGILWAYVFSQLITIVAFAPFTLRLYRNIGGSITHISIVDLFKHHYKWGVLTNYINTLGPNIRIWFIKIFLGTEAVGIFSVAHGFLMNTISLFSLSNIVNALMPKYLHIKSTFSNLVAKSIKYQFIGYTLLSILTITIFIPIINYIFPNYTLSISVFYILLLSLIPNSMASILTAFFITVRDQKSLFYATTQKTLYIIILSPVLILMFGIYGAAIEFLITTVLFTTNRYVILKKKYRELFTFRFKDMYSVDDLDKIFIQKILGQLSRFIFRYKGDRTSVNKNK